MDGMEPWKKIQTETSGVYSSLFWVWVSCCITSVYDVQWFLKAGYVNNEDQAALKLNEWTEIIETDEQSHCSSSFPFWSESLVNVFRDRVVCIVGSWLNICFPSAVDSDDISGGSQLVLLRCSCPVCDGVFLCFLSVCSFDNNLYVTLTFYAWTFQVGLRCIIPATALIVYLCRPIMSTLVKEGTQDLRELMYDCSFCPVCFPQGVFLFLNRSLLNFSNAF